MPLKILDLPLVFLGSLAGLERSKVSAFTCFWVLFSGI